MSFTEEQNKIYESLEAIPYNEHGFKLDKSGRIVLMKTIDNYEDLSLDNLELVKEFFVNYLHSLYAKFRLIKSDKDPKNEILNQEDLNTLYQLIGEQEIEYSYVMSVYYDKLEDE